MNSKWSYLACGVNVTVALVGAVLHSLPLILLGIGFGFFNWYIAEFNRRFEEASIYLEGVEYGKSQQADAETKK